MIPRYSRPEMTQIWDPATRFRIWFELFPYTTLFRSRKSVV